jgi:nitroimidazol reductase NimA-like FMN-containing flavoprotein (pyridoxamine 5'-phosphate oxidase superfamily)
MRRKEKEITDLKIINDLFANSAVCRIAMVDNGEPYLLPLNYGYRDNTLYIHSAAAGRKIEILKRNDRVCFEIEGPGTIVQHAEPCHWGTKARSLIGYGRVEIVTDLQEKQRGLDIIMAHHGKTDPNVYDEKQLRAVVILKIPVESVACKQLGDWS